MLNAIRVPFGFDSVRHEQNNLIPTSPEGFTIPELHLLRATFFLQLPVLLLFADNLHGNAWWGQPRNHKIIEHLRTS